MMPVDNAGEGKMILNPGRTPMQRANPPGEQSADHQGLSVILPVYNEAEAISAVLASLHTTLHQMPRASELIVVDDGSQDGTSELLHQVSTPLRLLQHGSNRGYGAALKTGIRQARYPLIAIIDADGTYPHEMLPKLVEHMSEADMVVGARIGEEVHVPWNRQPAKRFLQWLAT